MKKNIFLLAFFLAALSVSAFAAQPPVKGGTLPDFTLSTKNSAERGYLGVGSGPFRISNIKSSLVVIEVYSMYCPYCQKEAPNMNQLYNKIESDPALKGRIKIIGIGAGNSQLEVDTYRQRYKVPFPLFPDKEYEVHDLLGQPRTPFFIVVKLQPGGKEKVVSTQLGAYDSPDQFLDTVLRPALKEGK
ncbi:MAG: TlpA disulfide reductase family protein [Syntrophaceae bacterium]